MSQLQICVIDSHTGGEPTRVIIDGGPVLSGEIAQRARELQMEYERFRSAVVNEPRGSSVLVAALLTPPTDPSCAAGVIFFNNVGCLGMCGHGTIGLLVTLAWLGRIRAGEHRIETPVGVVTANLHDAHTVSVRNVASFRLSSDVSVHVEGHGRVRGDVAWGGNWFFLIADHGQRLELDNVERLTDFCWRVRRALRSAGVTGTDGAEIDHIELFGPPTHPDADSRNFVLCPGGAYDRSPCGTGTSAKLACLHADHKLRPGARWRQESITGSIFEGTFALDGDRVLPTITGNAWVTSNATLLLDPADPYCWGLAP